MTSSGHARSDVDVRQAFLAGAAVVTDAVCSPAVARRWHEASVLEDQTVGGLAGHLARGGVWVVADYLDAGDPTDPDDLDPAAYFSAFLAAASPQAHAAIRARGASVAAAGPDAVGEQLHQSLTHLRQLLPSLRSDRYIAVIGGAVMRLDDYLVTRIVEQTVHLDDLSRSVGHEWNPPDTCVDITTELAVTIARRRAGDGAVLRALYRQGFGDVFPVL